MIQPVSHFQVDESELTGDQKGELVNLHFSVIEVRKIICIIYHLSSFYMMEFLALIKKVLSDIFLLFYFLNQKESILDN